MDFSEVVRRRRMVRTYTDAAVAPELVDRIVDAGLRAPTAGDSRGVEILVLEDASDRDRFWHHVIRAPVTPGGRWDRLRAAPVLIIPFAHRDAYLARYGEADKAGLGMDTAEGWPHPYWFTDAAFAAMTMLLAATDLGLGALFFAVAHGKAEAMAALGVPPSHEPIGAITLGWPAEEVARRPRPSTARAHRGHWGRAG